MHVVWYDIETNELCLQMSMKYTKGYGLLDGTGMSPVKDSICRHENYAGEQELRKGIPVKWFAADLRFKI